MSVPGLVVRSVARLPVAAGFTLAVLSGAPDPMGASAPALAIGRQQPPPPQPTVQPPPPLQPLAVTQLDEPLPELAGDRTFSLRIAEPMPVAELLLFALRDTRFGLVLDPDVAGAFIGELKDVTIRQALDLVLHPLGLDYAVRGTAVHVFRRKLETRILDVNTLLTVRTASRASEATTAADGRPAGVRGAEPIGASASRVSSSDSGDVLQELAAGIQTLLSDAGRFNLDRKAGILQVTDYPDRIDRVSLYLDAVHQRLSRQVLIEAKVLEVELTDASSVGVDWLALVTEGGGFVFTQQVAPAFGAVLGARIQDFTALVRALSRQGRVNVLASPQVVALHNEPALMRVGTQEVFFITTSQVDAATGRLLQTTTSPQAITEGVVLSVTPQIGADGVVTMSIRPSVTERTGRTRSPDGGRVPVLSVRETDTLVRVPAGETIVVSGLMQERTAVTTSKVPVLGDIPGLGLLFRRDERRSRKTDLVILLTPTLVTPSGLVKGEKP